MISRLIDVHQLLKEQIRKTGSGGKSKSEREPREIPRVPLNPSAGWNFFHAKRRDWYSGSF